jgi:hypothetical protein
MSNFLKKIKQELFYVRQMIHYRYGFREWYRYILNKFFSLQLLRYMNPVLYELKDDFELHILTPKFGIWMAYWTIRSFVYHSGLCPHIVVHDDGTIDEKTVRLFESAFSNNNVSILRRVDADRQFEADPTIPSVVKVHRKKCKNTLLLMFIDHLFLSSSRRVLVLDNDILFYDRPTEIIDFMRGNSSVDAIYAVYGEYRNPIDMDEEYKKKYASILSDASGLNSGMMMFDKSKINFDLVAEYFEHTTKPNGHLIEQTGWGFVLSQIPHAFFPEERYRLRGNIQYPTVAKHFTTPRRHEMFAYGIDEARKRMGA